MTRQALAPGIAALFLIALMSLALAVHVDRGKTVLEDAYSQVVVVACGNAYGTGWFLDSSHVITAYHVIGSSSCSPVLVRGQWSSNASIVAWDPDSDIVLLEADNPPRWARGLPLSYSVATGDDVYVVGYPIQVYEQVDGDLSSMSDNPRALKASVAWIDPEGPYFSFQPGTDAGNSGGPVVSRGSGGVVGIVVYARHGIVDNEFYALRMDAVAAFLDSNGVGYRVAGEGSNAILYGAGALIAVIMLLRLGVFRP